MITRAAPDTGPARTAGSGALNESPPPTPPRPRRFDLRWAGLCVIVLVYSVLAVAYSRAIPLWQSPDEPAHYNYLAELGTAGELPVLASGDYDGAYLEAIKSRGFPASDPIDAIRYEGHQPPLYYLAGTPVYEVLEDRPLAERAAGLRLYSVALGAATLVVAFLIGRLILPGWLALGPALFIATIPQRLAMSASVNNDVAAELLMAIFLFGLLGVIFPASEMHRPGAGLARRLGHPVWLGILVGLLLLTKTTLYIGVVLVPLAFLLARNGGIRRAARNTAITWAVALLVSGWWFLRNMSVYGPADPLAQARHDAVATGQPATDLTPDAVAHFGATLFRSFWGQFGWMGVPLDDRSYLFVTVLTAALLVGAAFWLIRSAVGARRSAWDRRWLLLFGAVILLLFGGVVGYNLKYIQPQGRYLFAALVPIATLFTLGVRGWLPARGAAAGLLLLYPALLALDVWALVHVIGRGFG